MTPGAAAEGVHMVTLPERGAITTLDDSDGRESLLGRGSRGREHTVTWRRRPTATCQNVIASGWCRWPVPAELARRLDAVAQPKSNEHGW